MTSLQFQTSQLHECFNKHKHEETKNQMQCYKIPNFSNKVYEYILKSNHFQKKIKYGTLIQNTEYQQ